MNALVKTKPVISQPATDTIPEVDLLVGENVSDEGKTMEEKVINITRVSRTQKGGRRIRFRAVVIIGNHQGVVGMGIGKASEIATAVAKATYKAKKSSISVPIVRKTIPHEIVGKFDRAMILLKPAPFGTSVIAGSSVRPILELAGIENVVSKCLTRTTNKINNAYATFEALKNLKDIKDVAPRQLKKLPSPGGKNGTS